MMKTNEKDVRLRAIDAYYRRAKWRTRGLFAIFGGVWAYAASVFVTVNHAALVSLGVTFPTWVICAWVFTCVAGFPFTAPAQRLSEPPEALGIMGMMVTTFATLWLSNPIDGALPDTQGAAVFYGWLAVMAGVWFGSWGMLDKDARIDRIEQRLRAEEREVVLDEEHWSSGVSR